MARVLGPGTITATRQAITGVQKVAGVAMHANVYGIVCDTVRLKDVDASRNVIGVSTFDKAIAVRLTADDNRYVGLLSYGTARVSSSHLTGNVHADITTEEPPRVVKTTCEHSPSLAETWTAGIYSPTGPPWSVCSLD